MRALQIKENQLGAEHLDVVSSLNNLAILYRDLGTDEEAVLNYLRALKITEKQLGVEHPNVAMCLNNLALLYKSQGKYEEALIH